MKINSGFRDLLRAFNEAGVPIEPEEANARAMLDALASFGAPTADVAPADFLEPEVFFQIGVEPVRTGVRPAAGSARRKKPGPELSSRRLLFLFTALRAQQNGLAAAR